MQNKPRGGLIPNRQVEEQTEIYEGKLFFVKKNSGRQPFPIEYHMYIEIETDDGEEKKVEQWTPVDQDGRPLSLAQVKWAKKE